MPKIKEIATSAVGDFVSGASGPLGSLFGDKHSSASLTFPSDLEGVGERHFIRFNIVKVDGAVFESITPSSSTATGTNSVGDLIGGAVGAAVGGGLGGGIVGAIAGNAADSLGVSSAVSSIASGAQGLAGSVAGAAADFSEPIAGAALGAAEGIAGGLLGAAGDLAGGAVGAVGDLLSGDLPQLPSLEDLNVPLPDPTDILNVDNAWGSISAAASSTFGNLSSAAGSIRDAIIDNVEITADALNGIGETDSQEFSGASGGNSQKVGDILLYLPFNINESYQVNWQGGDMGVYGAMGESLMNIVNSGSVGEGMAAAYEELKGNAPGAVAEVASKVLGEKLGNENIQKFALKQMGVAVDPHFELFFQGVNPRSFTFDFDLSPKNSTEAQNIASIIRMFKMHAAPGSNKESTRYWTYPHYFEIEYWNSQNTHRIKPCALQQISVNYTGSGDNHTFYDGYPIKTTLSLTFQESVLLSRQDFESGEQGGY